MQQKINQNIKLIATDFDGILTDGFVYYSSETDEELKRISFKDIMGMSQAVKNGYKLAIISGEKNKIIDKVANKFNLEDIYQGVQDKLAALSIICEKYSLDFSQVCYLGDDINDISALEKVSFPVTVPDANYKVKEIKNIYITAANAGNGAFREIVDILLKNK